VAGRLVLQQVLISYGLMSILAGSGKSGMKRPRFIELGVSISGAAVLAASCSHMVKHATSTSVAVAAVLSAVCLYSFISHAILYLVGKMRSLDLVNNIPSSVIFGIMGRVRSLVSGREFIGLGNVSPIFSKHSLLFYMVGGV
jgi:hypothetical protein